MPAMPELKDFTVEVSTQEKALTSLLFIFGMGAVVYLARHYSMPQGHPPGLYYNLCFALAVYGVVRMARCAFQQTRRGLVVGSYGVQVVTLFSTPRITFEDLRETTLLTQESPRPEVSFRWGQFRYRLPCSNIAELTRTLRQEQVRVVPKEEATTTLPQATKYRSQRPSSQILMSLIFWSVGTAAMFYTKHL